MALPARIQGKVERPRIVSLGMLLLRPELEPEVKVGSKWPAPGEAVFPFVMVQKMPLIGEYSGDDRFHDVGGLLVHCYAAGPNAHIDAENLADVVRGILQRADHTQPYFPGKGQVRGMEMLEEPLEGDDFGISAGPTQQANLPEQVARATTVFRMTVRLI